MTKIKQFIKLWPEVWSLPLAFVLWYLSPFMLRMLDPVAATFDAGIFQKLMYAGIGGLVFNSMAFMGIRFNFPLLFDYYASEDALHDFKSLTAWQKILCLLCLYLGLLLALVLITISI